jgi:hypothetical protein
MEAELATIDLPPENPSKLRAALNISLFYINHEKNIEKALKHIESTLKSIEKCIKIDQESQ